jgi:hypothetical protein
MRSSRIDALEPAQWPGGIDRCCPLGTVRARPLWHAGSTAVEHDVPRSLMVRQAEHPALAEIVKRVSQVWCARVVRPGYTAAASPTPGKVD